MMNGCVSFFDEVGAKDNLLACLNPIEWGEASASV
jgi:hypothetical protein